MSEVWSNICLSDKNKLSIMYLGGYEFLAVKRFKIQNKIAALNAVTNDQ